MSKNNHFASFHSLLPFRVIFLRETSASVHCTSGTSLKKKKTFTNNLNKISPEEGRITFCGQKKFCNKRLSEQIIRNIYIQEIYCRQIVSNRARPCLQGDGWKSSIRLTRTLLSLPSQFWGKLVRFRVMMQVWWEVLPEAVCMHKSISNNLTTASHRLYLSYKQRNKSFGKSHQWLVSKVGRVGVRARYEILIDVKTGNRISIDARHHMLHRQTRIVHSKNNRPAKMHLLSHSEVSGLLHCLVPASRNFYSHVL